MFSSPPTLKQVAEAAGVSVSVASRVLNGHARQYRIREETEEQVRKVAKSLAFQPSRLARSLRLQKSGLIGVVLPDLSNAFFAAIPREITLTTEADGYSVIIADSREATTNEMKLIQELLDRQIEALVVCPVGVESQHLVADTSGLPIVLVDRVFPDSELMQAS